MEWYYYLLLTVMGELLGLTTFFSVLGKRYRAHLRGFRDVAKFYICPFPPRVMVRYVSLDGNEKVYYNDSCVITDEESSSKIVCRDGLRKTSKVKLRESGVYRRFYDLKAGEGVPSPLSPLTRWFIARPLAIYIAYYLPWALAMEQPMIFQIYSYVLIVVFMSLLIITTKMMARDTFYIALMDVGDDVIPLPTESSMNPISFIKALGIEVKVTIPEAVRNVFEEIKKKVKGDVLAAMDILNMFRSKTQEETISLLLEQGLKFVKIGETWAMERAKPLKPRIRIPTALAIFVVAFVIGGIVGYVFGSTWGISPTPPTYSYNYTVVTPAKMPTLTPSNATHVVVTPAKPPSPPTPTKGVRP